jgi:hypothetical protein
MDLFWQKSDGFILTKMGWATFGAIFSPTHQRPVFETYSLPTGKCLGYNYKKFTPSQHWA